MDDVRIGIVGLGNMGTLTADFIYAGDVEHCVIGAICDIREERILYAKKHFTHLSEDCFYKDFRNFVCHRPEIIMNFGDYIHIVYIGWGKSLSVKSVLLISGKHCAF